MQMFCSIIIPTVGRPSLSKSVSSVLEQNCSKLNFEIIVVNDSGQPLPPAEWQKSERVQMICTQKRERCFARNTGAAIAKGDYLCFLDDDDWFLPNALDHFWSLVQIYPDAAWFYGGVEFVDSGGETLGYLNQRKTGNCFVEAMTETWIPLQASLIRAEAFFEVGGFNPEFVVTQDLDLLRRIAFRHDLAATPENTACIQRGSERKAETRYTIAWLYIAKGRDNLLAEPKALSRLLDSAGDSAFLRGLVLRNYKSATLFNLRRFHWLTAVSRLISGIKALLKSFRYVFTRNYWFAAMGSRALHPALIEKPAPAYNSVDDWLYG
jgi:glycosyltransferase involved in cell wall biosynthesis